MHAVHRCALFGLYSLCVFVCLSVGDNRELYRNGEPIEVPFEMWTQVEPRDHALDGTEIHAIMMRPDTNNHYYNNNHSFLRESI